MASNKDDGGWKKFVWNSDKGEFCGRTGGSWFKILGFYLIFYSFLAGLFVGTIQCLLLTLSDYKPTWQDRVAPPGLSHTPRSDKSELAFNLNDLETYLPYIKAMREFMSLYDEDKQLDQMKYEDCGEEPADYKYRGDLDSDVGVRKACRFQRSWLGPCSGIEDREFGFKEGKPCLIVKLNRIVNFKPRPPTSNDSIPEAAQNKVQPNVIPHLLHQQERGGRGKLLHPHYLQPLVAIQFVNLTMNTELRIECKVFGENIGYSEKDKFQGRFDIKLLVTNL
ncbi:hypothetical protein UPYG_G00021850 [Umbra pygmaea]|uniref:Sodium/potassium-transporting ATPase subunit beta n=1 Tax=Umbra pygmaea TaxID=75934 RepID=A0ABD0Y501_UMBPY